VPLVTLTSDFGVGSPYVAAMKAAVLATCPDAALVDVAHDLEPFAVEPAAFVFWAGTRHFDPPAVHLAVVDPGVGTERRVVAVRAGGATWVAPDNGLLDMVLDGPASTGATVEAVELTRPESASATFEGRDVLAPAAGRLAAGAPLPAVGSRVELASLRRLPERGPRVVWTDRFGNLVTNLAPPARPLLVDDVEVRVVARTYGEAPAGTPFVYLGSMGFLEVGVREGRADRALDAGPGSVVSEAADG
jgi:S-adenosylmethionine hydrolase